MQSSLFLCLHNPSDVLERSCYFWALKTHYNLCEYSASSLDLFTVPRSLSAKTNFWVLSLFSNSSFALNQVLAFDCSSTTTLFTSCRDLWAKDFVVSSAKSVLANGSSEERWRLKIKVVSKLIFGELQHWALSPLITLHQEKNK